MTLEEVLVQAFIKNGILADGEPLPAELGASGLNDANILLEEFNITSVMIWTTNILQFDLFALTSPTVWYTIGPSDADFIAARPTRISSANIVLTGTPTNTRIPIQIVNDAQWSDVVARDLGSSPYPTKLYNDGSFPNSRLYLWPYPNTTANALELFVPNAVATFTTITDDFAMPPGGLGAFMYTLAERLCEGKKQIPDNLARTAARMRNAFGRINRNSPKMSTTDSGMPNGGMGDGPGNNFWSGWSAR